MIVPVTMTYFEAIADLLQGMSRGSAPSALRALFLKSNEFTDTTQDLQQKVTSFK